MDFVESPLSAFFIDEDDELEDDGFIDEGEELDDDDEVEKLIDGDGGEGPAISGFGTIGGDVQNIATEVDEVGADLLFGG